MILSAAFSHLALVLALQTIAEPVAVLPERLQGDGQYDLEILGAVQIKHGIGKVGQITEFSGLAFNHDEADLILLSDRGFILHADPIFEQGRLIDLKFRAWHALKDANQRRLQGKAKDSEGLAVANARNHQSGDTELLVSFERIPRIVRYTPDGQFIAEVPLHNTFNDSAHYVGKNKALEAITLHPEFKIITGPERPLASAPRDLLSLHTLAGKTWSFRPKISGSYAALVGLTTLPDGRLIALERASSGVFFTFSNALHLITLGEDALKQETLVLFRHEDGYFNDNFEGISWHEGNRFFMISDNQGIFMKRTLLLYFAIIGLNSEPLLVDGFPLEDSRDITN